MQPFEKLLPAHHGSRTRLAGSTVHPSALQMVLLDTGHLAAVARHALDVVYLIEVKNIKDN